MKDSILPLGSLGVELKFRKGIGGEGTSADENSGRMAITIGINDTWIETVDTIIHEAFELAAVMRRLRYRSEDRNGQEGSAGTIFIMSHEDMEQAISDAATFCARAIPRAAAAWRKQNKGREIEA